MNENILTIAFIIFVVFVVFFVAILRKISLQDVSDDNAPSSSVKASEKSLSQIQSPTVSAFSQEKKGATDKRQKINKIAKTISVVGFIMLFIPLPETYRLIGLALTFIGSMVAKATAPPKVKTSARQALAHLSATQNPRDPKKSA